MTLREVGPVRQIRGEPRRRWFSDDRMDLTVWLDDGDAIVGFQLTYDKPHAEKALTWRVEGGLSHARVDDGEARNGKHKSTPILVGDGSFDAWHVCGELRRRSARLPEAVRELVCRYLTSAQGNVRGADPAVGPAAR